MKPITYHYVRPGVPGLTHFPFLKLADFERQFDHFANTDGFVSREAFESWLAGGAAPRGVLLTFDDGLRDHVDYVLPVLKKRGLFALFYACSGPVLTGRFLDVHRVHLVIGRLGGLAVLRWLQANVPEVLPSSKQNVETHYANQHSDRETKFVKQLLNWRLDGEVRNSILDALMRHAFADAAPDWRQFYLDEKGLARLVDAGMAVGPHGHTHRPATLLSAEELSLEIALASDFIDSVGGSRMWGYCYPHGSCTEESQRAVSDAGLPFAFALGPRDVDLPLTESCCFALPRHDCNTFPCGHPSY